MISLFSHKIRLVFGPFLSLILLVYFGYHLIQGERGVLSWLRLQQKNRDLQAVLMNLQEKQYQLEQRIDLLKPPHLDADMLEEQVRSKLNYGLLGERVVVDSISEKS